MKSAMSAGSALAVPQVTASPAGPLLLWLALQCAALAVAAAQIPFSYNYPIPAERAAIQMMLVVQIGASAMLFPYLLRDARTSAAVVFSIVPFVVLAGFLSVSAHANMVSAALCVAVWLCGLAIWRAALPGLTASMSGVAVASALALGGPILWYGRIENGHGGLAAAAQARYMGPVMAALSLAAADPWTAGIWVLFAGHLALALIGLALSKRLLASRRAGGLDV